jgi:hypothetical protein
MGLNFQVATSNRIPLVYWAFATANSSWALSVFKTLIEAISLAEKSAVVFARPSKLN